MNIVIIIPTYNERGNVEKLIPILEEEIFPKIKNHTMHILIADDYSTDGTSEAVRIFMKKWKNIDINQGEKKGLGAAYIRAMTYAIEKMKADIIFEMDGDRQHDEKKIPEFLKKIDEGNDMVIGTRYSAGGSIPKNWPLQRKAFSIFANLLIRTVFGRFSIHDWTGGYRALRKEVFLKEKNKLTEFKGYTFQVSFLHKVVSDNFKVVEVPFHFTDRTLGDSKIAPAEYIVNVLRYVFTARFFELLHSSFIKYAITGFIGYVINATLLEAFKYYFGLHSGVAASLGAEVTIVWNFLMNNFWAFKSDKITSPAKLFFKFLQFNLVAVGSLILIGIVVWTGTHTFGDTGLVRQISLVLGIGFLVIPYSYTMYNIFIWKRWKIKSLEKIQNAAG